MNIYDYSIISNCVMHVTKNSKLSTTQDFRRIYSRQFLDQSLQEIVYTEQLFIDFHKCSWFYPHTKIQDSMRGTFLLQILQCQRCHTTLTIKCSKERISIFLPII